MKKDGRISLSNVNAALLRPQVSPFLLPESASLSPLSMSGWPESLGISSRAAVAASFRNEFSSCDAAANTLRAFSPGGHNFRDGANGLGGTEAEEGRGRSRV